MVMGKLEVESTPRESNTVFQSPPTRFSCTCLTSARRALQLFVSSRRSEQTCLASRTQPSSRFRSPLHSPNVRHHL